MKSDQKTNKSLISRYWWIPLFFFIPFLTVGGFWAILSWGKVIDDAGRSQMEINAFAPDAVLAFVSGLFQHGTIPGLIGLILAGVALIVTKRIRRCRSK